MGINWRSEASGISCDFRDWLSEFEDTVDSLYDDLNQRDQFQSQHHHNISFYCVDYFISRFIFHVFFYFFILNHSFSVNMMSSIRIRIYRAKLNQNQSNQKSFRLIEKTTKLDIEHRIREQMRLILNLCVSCVTINDNCWIDKNSVKCVVCVERDRTVIECDVLFDRYEQMKRISTEELETVVFFFQLFRKWINWRIILTRRINRVIKKLVLFVLSFSSSFSFSSSVSFVVVVWFFSFSFSNNCRLWSFVVCCLFVRFRSFVECRSCRLFAQLQSFHLLSSDFLFSNWRLAFSDYFFNNRRLTFSWKI